MRESELAQVLKKGIFQSGIRLREVAERRGCAVATLSRELGGFEPLKPATVRACRDTMRTHKKTVLAEAQCVEAAVRAYIREESEG